MRIRVVFFATLESRAEAHIAAAIDAVVEEVAAAEVRAPRVARAALRRRPVAAREAFTRVVRGRYV